MTGLIFLLFIGLFLAIFCLLPWIIAKSRGHNNSLAILVCSIVGIPTLGILWVVALIWAFTSDTK